MKKIKVALCDDEENVGEVIAETVRSAFSKKGISADMETFVTASSLLRRMENVVFDLIFLDIDMPGMDGIELGAKLRASGSHTDIIYVSNREERVFDALKVRPFGFVRKSNFIADITEAVSRYADSFTDGGKMLVVQSKRETVNVRETDVVYFEGAGKFQNMYISGREQPVPVYRSMETLEEELSPRGFIRVHKGMLVNYRYISRLLPLEVELTTGDTLPVSRRKAAEIKQKYLSLLAGNGGVML